MVKRGEYAARFSACEWLAPSGKYGLVIAPNCPYVPPA
jgi:hypothetical protein